MRKGKPSKSKRPSPSWREFEKLVARIEETLAPRGAIVKSPDHIRSHVTGGRREVDASIRFRIGTVDVLITVECRKRRPKQDVTWIEQLNSKKMAIGAARTIAVSPLGFSEGAARAAEAYGLDLRRLAEVSPEDIRSWVLPTSLVHLFRKCTLISFGYGIKGDSGPLPELEASEAKEVARRQADARIFRLLADGSRLSLNDLWLRAQNQNDFYVGVPLDGTTFRRRIRLGIPDNTIGVLTTAGLRSLTELTFEADLAYGHEEIPLNEAAAVHYTSPSGVDVRRVEFLTKGATSRNLRFGMQSEGESREAVCSIELLDACNNPYEPISNT